MPAKKIHSEEEARALRQIEAMRSHLHERLRTEFNGSMSVAADTIGLSKSSFYRHFPQGSDVKVITGEVPLRILVVVSDWLHANSPDIDAPFPDAWANVTADV